MMTDPATREQVEALRTLYEVARERYGRDKDWSVTAAKRVHVEKSDAFSDWYIGYGKDESCQIEGTANHWRWLAMVLLGLADRRDVPYTEDKPTPEVVPSLLALIDSQRAEIERLNNVIAWGA